MCATEYLPISYLELKYIELCSELNLTEDFTVKPWEIYTQVKKKFLLEGENQLHWLCCALYVACQQTLLPSGNGRQFNEVDTTDGGGGGDVVLGIRLNHLLRSCNLSIYEFFSKIKSWCIMTNTSTKIQYKIKRIERQFRITLIIFEHYKDLFKQLYQLPAKSQHRTRWTSVNSSKRYNSNNLYDMCWLLFLCAKSELPKLAQDLVSTYYLLICCMELIYRNVLAEKRWDLINTKLDGFPQWLDKPDIDISSLDFVMDCLCNLTMAIPAELKKMKREMFVIVLENFIESKIVSLKENASWLSFTADSVFWINYKSLDRSYEQYVLSVCELDERVLPNYDIFKDKATKLHCLNDIMGNDVQIGIDYTWSVIATDTITQVNDGSRFMANLVQLQNKYDGISNSVPQFIIQQTGSDLSEHNHIKEMLKIVQHKFLAACKLAGVAEKIVNKYFDLAMSLNNYMLEKIVRNEYDTKPNLTQITQILAQTKFIKSLITCCLELVLKSEFSNLCEMKFPWILQCLEVEPYDFYKIIEIVVLRHDGTIPRALIKHLNHIEEISLETLIWRTSSVLWDFIEDNLRLPDYQTVKAKIAVTPAKNKCVRSLWKNDLLNEKNVQMVQEISSLGLFLRKFYKLAWFRLDKLCKDLNINDEQEKVWKIFEHSITHYSATLMRQRHLDQLLMCAIYIYLRIHRSLDKSFVEIIKFYRKQPQAKSNVYREVAVNSLPTHSQQEQPPKNNKEYCDLISFYNKIYVSLMSIYVLELNKEMHVDSPASTAEKQNALEGDTTPIEEDNDTQFKRVSPRHFIYVKTLAKSSTKSLPCKLTHEFSNRSFSVGSASLNSRRKRPNILKMDATGSK